jgi:hypothetical protein
MRKTILGLFVIGFLLTSCGNKKIIEARPEHSAHIHNVTMQEMVSGVQGQGNTFQFYLNIEMDTSVTGVDSLYFDKMKGKVFLKDASTSLFMAKLKAPLNPSPLKASSKDVVTVTFIHKGNRIVLAADSVITLDKMYMP